MAEEQAPTSNQLLAESIYLKDLSFVSPQAPQSFAPDLKVERLMNIRSTNSELGGDRREVTLTVKVREVAGADLIFEIEVVQAGVFRIAGFNANQRLEILGRVCPEILFPYVRTAMDEIARKGGFPNMLLNPIDFRELFAQNMREWAAESRES